MAGLLSLNDSQLVENQNKCNVSLTVPISLLLCSVFRQNHGNNFRTPLPLQKSFKMLIISKEYKYE